MKKTVYLNLNLDNPLDLEMYNLLEGLGRNKKSVVQLALMKNGWLSGGSIPNRIIPKPNSQKKSPVKNRSQEQEKSIQSTPIRTERFVHEQEPVKELVVSTPSYEEVKPINHFDSNEQTSQSTQPNHTYVVDNGREPSGSSQLLRRYFSDEQIEEIKKIPNVNMSVFESEQRCQVMKEEVGDSTDHYDLRDAYNEVLWIN